MNKLPLALLLVLGGLSCIGGCDAGPDRHAYPGLLDLQAVSIADLRQTAPVPGRYNVSGTVVDVRICYCPPGAVCAPCEFPDGLVLSETGAPLPAEGYGPDAPTHLFIAAEDPEQFVIGRRYAFSVEVEPDETQRPVRLAQLLGFARR